MTKLNTNKNSVLLHGYDPVSYFDHTPTKGTSSIKAKYKGAIYYFSSKENKEKFKANPDKFTPQYGGFCATAISEGKYVPIHPKSYKITNDKLYVFYKGIDGKPIKPWIADEKNLIKLSDKVWKEGKLTTPPAPAILLWANKVIWPY